MSLESMLAAQHIAYTNPLKMPHGGIRVSYKYGLGVFATRYNWYRDEYQDMELDDASLAVLKNVVSGLWRTGMPLRYEATVNQADPVRVGRYCKKLLVVEFELIPEDELVVIRECFPDRDPPLPVAMTSQYKRKNRADEWVSLGTEELSQGTRHLLWYELIKSVTEARNAQDKAEIDETRRLAISPYDELRVPSRSPSLVQAGRHSTNNENRGQSPRL